jgi:hypothetical protein
LLLVQDLSNAQKPEEIAILCWVILLFYSVPDFFFSPIPLRFLPLASISSDIRDFQRLSLKNFGALESQRTKISPAAEVAGRQGWSSCAGNSAAR